MRNHLISTTLLQGGKYKIEKVLGQGGFGITYLAEQVMLGRKVAIKEFFMKELCERDETTSHVTLGTEGCRETVSRFREKFLKEARNIAKLNHPNIVRIIDVFEENGTAYYVMEYAENGSLADKVKKDGYLSEPVATRYILQVADALEYIHQRKMNHLDIKPGNIMLNEKVEAILIDFGLSKQYDATTGNQTSTTPVGISEGYAPMEQYKQGGVGEFSPETDIYALGATFFKLLTGVTPPSASDVMEDGISVDTLKAKEISPKAINAICNAMNSRKKDRIHKVVDFTETLNTNNKDSITKDSNLHNNDEKSTGKSQQNDETIVANIKSSTITDNQKSEQISNEDHILNEYDFEDKPWYKEHLKLCIIVICLGIFLCALTWLHNPTKSENVTESIDTTSVDSVIQDDNAVTEDKVYDVVEQMPEYPGGTEALMQYLSSNIKYPEKCENEGIQGRVVCSFVVEKDGSVTNVKVNTSINPLLDAEAVRVIKSLPNWSPGKQNQKNVRVKYTLPITFRLE